jgi:phosphoribosyl 1,2-cyclic phosphodiesterase
MRLVFLGTSGIGLPLVGVVNPPSGPARHSSFCLVVQPNYPQPPTIVIDVGPDFRQQWTSWPDAPVLPDAIVITHGDFDHIGGLAGMLPSAPVPLFAPSFAIERLRQYAALFPARPTLEAFRLDVHEVAPGETATVAGIPMQSLKILRSGPANPDSGVLIRHGGRSFAHLSDTSYEIDESTRRAISGVDLLVVNTPIMEDTGYHIGIPSTIRLAQEVGAKRLVISHRGHTVSEQTLAELVGANPWVAIAQDGMVIDL